VTRPFTIGIAGGSCSGKTAFALHLKAALARSRVRVLHMDHFYKPSSRLPRYWSPTLGGWHPDYNSPDCMQWGELRAACRRAAGADVLIVDGLLALHDPWLRRRTDLAIFMACPEPERRRRILRRGVPGWDRRRHLRYWHECVERGFRRHVAPTRRRADLVVAGG